MPWERHSSSRRWVRQRSIPRAPAGRLPGRPSDAPRDRPPPPSPTRTERGSHVSNTRVAAERSAHAHRSAARRYIARLTGGGPDPPDGARSGRTGAPRAWRSPRSAGLQRPRAAPETGRPESKSARSGECHRAIFTVARARARAVHRSRLLRSSRSRCAAAARGSAPPGRHVARGRGQVRAPAPRSAAHRERSFHMPIAGEHERSRARRTRVARSSRVRSATVRAALDARRTQPPAPPPDARRRPLDGR